MSLMRIPLNQFQFEKDLVDDDDDDIYIRETNDTNREKSYKQKKMHGL